MTRFRCAPFLLLLPLFLLVGCAASNLRGVVFDANGLQKEVSRITTNKGAYIELLDGLAVRRILLSKISVLMISPKEATSFKGELYYLTEIWLTDGNKIQSYVLPDGRRSGAYVNVNSVLTASTSSGPFNIKLKDVKQVKFTRL
ncbi:MAG: hypothetical protein V1913_11840 [Fibrobacterota bacterium]